MNVKLLPRDWLTAAFDLLAEGGVAAIKIEVLAKRLKVTKGGFYWHFRNRDDLLGRMLEHWRERRIETIRSQVAGEGDPRSKLEHLLSLYTDSTNQRGNAIELAVRDWARNDPRAAEIVAEVDQVRLESVASLFLPLGHDRQQAEARAFLFYSYCFGQSLLVAREPGALAPLRAACRALLVN